MNGRHRPSVQARRGLTRINAVITTLALAGGLWLGFTAPSRSPVAPQAPSPAVGAPAVAGATTSSGPVP